MTASIHSRPPEGLSGPGLAESSCADRPAARAFASFSRAGVLLGLIGLAAFVPVFVRLLESWRLSPQAVSHHVAILGQRLGYPTANAGAVVVLALALFGGIVTAIALCAIGRELMAARRSPVGSLSCILHSMTACSSSTTSAPRRFAPACCGLASTSAAAR